MGELAAPLTLARACSAGEYRRQSVQDFRFASSMVKRPNSGSSASLTGKRDCHDLAVVRPDLSRAKGRRFS
jgi:hypothetical protein